jgi:hypothetical protein
MSKGLDKRTAVKEANFLHTDVCKATFGFDGYLGMYNWNMYMNDFARKSVTIWRLLGL